MQKFFIAGTDTEVGKTFVSQLIIKALIDKGFLVAGLKPIASGATLQQNEWQNEDAQILQSASNMDLPYYKVNPFCFEPAIAPHIAAEKIKVKLTLEQLQQAVRIPQQADYVIIEGAGGWLTPLNQTETFADWVEANQLPVILVVGMKLGCLNHAMLTINNIQQRGLKIAGWVANFVQGDMKYGEENLNWLRANISAPCLGVIPQQIGAENLSHLLDLKPLA